MSIAAFIKYSIKILKVSLLLILTSASSYSLARTHYLQPGQSKTIKLDSKIRTIFIAKDSIANYEIINDKSIIIYAKKNGSTGIVVYSDNDEIILNDMINVDPILSQVNYQIKRDFPNSNIDISRYEYSENGEQFAYILNGSVPNTETKQKILDFIAIMLGNDKKRIEYSTSNGELLYFLDKNISLNIIDQIRVTEETQVNVKLTFVEVSKSFTDSLGIEWQGLTLDSMINDGSAVNSVGEFALLGLKKGFNINNITTMIRAINSDKLAKVLAQPNLSVLSGETATFLVGGEIPIVKMGTTNESSSIEYKEYGIKLDIGAKVHDDKRIRLFIADEFSSLSNSYQFNNYDIPILSTRKTSSTIDVGDGDSFVIAGLISEQDEEKLVKIPFLGDIPILGALARSATTSRTKTELVVFATVNIVTPKTSFDGVELPIFNRTNTTNLFFNINMSNHNKQSISLNNESEKFINYMGFIE